VVAARIQQRGSAERTRGVVIIVFVLQPSVYALSVEHVVTVHEFPNLVLHLQLAETNRTRVLCLWEPVLNLSEGGEQKGGVSFPCGLRTGFRWVVVFGGCGCVVDESEEEAEDPSENCNDESSLVYGLAYCEAGERVFDVEPHWNSSYGGRKCVWEREEREKGEVVMGSMAFL